MRAPSERTILSAPPGRVYYGDGLVLIVTPSNRRWIFRYTSPLTGRVTETTIGPYPAFTYYEARNEITRMRQLLAKGQDPVQAKRQQRSAGTTFAEAYEGWVKKHRSKWRSLRHVKIFMKHAQSLANTPIRMINRPMIVDAISDLWERHPNQALRVLQMMAQVFYYAKTMGYCDGDNPAVWRGNLEHVFHLPKNDNKHYPSLPFKDVPELIQRLRLRQVKGHSAAALEFQILTASRPGEVRNMRWSEIDLVNGIWTLPPERTKQNRQHRVPLSSRCMEILALQNEYRPGELVFRTSEFVFQGYKGVALDEKSVYELLKRMDLPKHITPHGFRASFRNWAAHSFPRDRDLPELCLGHTVKGQVESAYWTDDMLEQRRPIMNAWAEFCG